MASYCVHRFGGTSHPTELAKLLSGLNIQWWVAGGWALDLYKGKQIRSHGDTDVLILRRDQLAIQEFLSDWDLHKTQQPGLKPWPRGEFLTAGINDVWCRQSEQADWRFQIMFMETDGEFWFYRRAPEIRGMVTELGLIAAGGVPIIRPEIQLLYKSTLRCAEKENGDFDSILPFLDDKCKIWLRSALEICYSGCHPWLERLQA